MLKPAHLFFSTLLIVASFQVMTWADAPDPVDRSLSVPVPQNNYIPLPEDILPVSDDYWRQRYGCQHSGLSYSGFSSQDNNRFAVINQNNQQQIYLTGDSLNDNKSSRIVHIDPQNVVVKRDGNIQVLCRDITELSPVSLGTPLPENHLPELPASSAYHSAFGILEPVTDDHGNINGYRLKQCLRYCWLLNRYKIYDGDVITAIQGQPLNHLSADYLKNLLMGEGKDISVELKRNGDIQTVILPWQQISPFIHLFKPGVSL